YKAKTTLLGGTTNCEECGVNPHWTERLAQFRAFPSQAVNVFLGDSIVHVGHWREIFPNHSVLNRGIGFDKTTDVLARLGTAVSANPRRVFIMMGVNDFNLARREPGDVFATYVQVIEGLTARDIDVVIQSTIECADCGNSTEKIRRLNSMLEDYCDAHRLVYLDLNRALADSGGLRTEYQQDGVHPNVAGYKVWAALVEPLLL
ncbi:MAG: GDSL-type esterase/lipase family protein, partial [Gammaproteobacteria bacterium]|nr:GDSL-type esterase/lipase family protein [Gammaproteobacteria bacterium]